MYPVNHAFALANLMGIMYNFEFTWSHAFVVVFMHTQERVTNSNLCLSKIEMPSES